MNRKVDKDSFLDFLNATGKSKLEFARLIGISYSHLHGMINESIKMGDRTQKKIKDYIHNHNLDVDIEDFLKPRPFENLESVTVYKKDTNEVIAIITSRDVIANKDYEVKIIV